MTPAPWLSRFLRDERGAAMVEFALVATIAFFPLFFGFIELGRTVIAKSTVTTAAREGTRYAIVNGAESPGGPAADITIANYVKGRTALSPIVVTPTWQNASKRNPTWVQVQVDYVYVPLFPLLPSRTLTSRSRQVIAF